ncbi:MAG: transcriptional repressor LexA [Chloroflexota bacterium]|nr:transcriptional repressor LexA [Chloroflexota bacterium]
MKKLSAKQARIMEFLRWFIDDRGYPPTIRDIARGCDISSTSVVEYNLRVLEKDGHITRDREVSRGIGLGDRPVLRVPVIGTIAAGEPIPVPSADAWSPERTADTVELPEGFTRCKEAIYALRVKGTSMIDALIVEGDLVLMQQASTAENGDMVAAWLKDEGEATLKKFYLENGKVRLQPANESMAPIYADPRNVEIQGRVVGVIRRLA